MLITTLKRDEPIIRLARVQETTSKRTWIFDFVDPKHKFAQSIIAPKDVPPQVIEMAYERMWLSWMDKIRTDEWRSGNASVVPLVS